MEKTHATPYAPLNGFAAAARDRPELWRLPLTAALVFGLGFGGTILLYRAAALVAPDFYFVFWSQPGSSPAGMVFLLAGFAVWLAAIFAAVALVHRRGPPGLFGAPRQACRDGWRAGRAAALLFVAVSLLLWPFEQEATRNVALPVWLLWLVPALLFLAVQVTAEEVFFRGYLQQQLAARFRSPWLWMVAPSVLFGALHHDPSLGTMSYGLILATGATGLALADLTARSGTLGPAIALHFVNNVIALLLVSVQDDMAGLALWTVDLDLSDPAVMVPLIALDLMTTLCLWLAARLVLRV